MSALPFQESGFVGVEKFNAIIRDHAELIMLVILAVVYMNYTVYEKQAIQNVKENPKVNDFFYVDYAAIKPDSDHRFRYIPMRIMNIDEAGITFKVGNIAHTTPVSPREHVKLDRALLLPNYYRVDPLFLSHEEIDDLWRSNAIYNARRPRSIYIDGWMVMHLHEIVVDDDL